MFKIIKIENDWALFICILSATVLMSIVTVKIEVRFLEPWRQRFGQRTKATPPVIFSVMDETQPAV